MNKRANSRMSLLLFSMLAKNIDLTGKSGTGAKKLIDMSSL
jgi:hypothetical protein